MNEENSLPNSVGVLKNNNIVIAEGGNNRINLYTYEGKLLKTIGEFGFDKYKFKEPVGVFVSPDQKIYVMDWHNHRVVLYTKNLVYLNEFGHFGNLNEKNILKIYFGFLKQLTSPGSYYRFHFNKKNKNEKLNVNKNRLVIFINSLKYWFYRNNGFIKSIREIKNKKDFINKPNGIAFLNNKIYLTQKKNNCISVYENTDKIRFVRIYKNFKNGIKFSRLGNIKSNNRDRLFICDEGKRKIYLCDNEFNILNTITGKNSTSSNFLPFSCDLINDRLFVTCGGFNFQIISLYDNKVLYVSEDIGELHGIAYNSKLHLLYVVNRNQGLIYIYKLKFY